MKIKQNSKVSYNAHFILLASALLVFILNVICFLWVYFYHKAWIDHATFGDLFVALNCLFSGLAFIGIIYTIYLQREEFKLHQDEQIRQNKSHQTTENALIRQIELLNTSTKLSALHTLIEYYSSHMEINQNESPFAVAHSLKRKMN